jgi:hypothetical protein
MQGRISVSEHVRRIGKDEGHLMLRTLIQLTEMLIQDIFGLLSSRNDTVIIPDDR